MTSGIELNFLSVEMPIILFVMDNRTPEQRRKNMQAVKSAGSRIERSLGSALWARGLRYRKNDVRVFGKPDFTFARLKIAVFVDSEFWHGKDWELRKSQHKSNRDFWIQKIENNIDRDRIVNAKLAEEGWRVIRFWGQEIRRDLAKCVAIVEDAAARTQSDVKSLR